MQFQCPQCGARFLTYPSPDQEEDGAVPCFECGESVPLPASYGSDRPWHPKAMEEFRRSGERELGPFLVKRGYVSEMEIVTFLGEEYGVPPVDVSDKEIPSAVAALVSRELCEKYTLIPIAHEGTSITVAFCDPSDPSNAEAIDNIKFMTGQNVRIVVGGREAIRAAIVKYFADPGSER